MVGLTGAAATVWLGLPDVAATTPHWAVTEWVLATTMERSVQRRARDTAVPDDLDDPARIRAGAAAYDDMCAGCHAAPGIEADVVGKGLVPAPPDLEEEAAEWNEAELFWITKHGIRMTGMPAFDPTHSDRELWDVVAFLRRLPGMPASEYTALVDTGGRHSGHEHGHDPKPEREHSH